MTPKQRVETVLRGGLADPIPFTMYEGMAPQCTAEREMRNRGLCMVRRSPVFHSRQPHCTFKDFGYWENGRKLIRTVVETPAGTLTSVSEPAGFTSWKREYFFKSADDYRAIRFLLADEEYEECYADFAAAEKAVGGDMICRAGIGLEPLQQLISGQLLSSENFCIEWMERRDEILKLYDLLVEKRRQIYPLVAKSPALHANYGGNVVPEIIGLETFRTHYVPHYNEAAEVFHRHGKLIGCHFDANCRLLAEEIGRTGLDYIEAFTPSPDTDMTLAEARRAWPDKILWLNFPSSLHLRPDAEIEAATVRMLDETGRPDGVIMGITENIPEDRWQDSCRAIMNGLDRYAERRKTPARV